MVSCPEPSPSLLSLRRQSLQHQWPPSPRQYWANLSPISRLRSEKSSCILLRPLNQSSRQHKSLPLRSPSLRRLLHPRLRQWPRVRPHPHLFQLTLRPHPLRRQFHRPLPRLQYPRRPLQWPGPLRCPRLPSRSLPRRQCPLRLLLRPLRPKHRPSARMPASISQKCSAS